MHRIHWKDLVKIYIYANIHSMVSLREGKGGRHGNNKSKSEGREQVHFEELRPDQPHHAKRTKEEVKAAAGRAGESLNEYINRAVTNRMETDEENSEKNV